MHVCTCACMHFSKYNVCQHVHVTHEHVSLSLSIHTRLQALLMLCMCNTKLRNPEQVDNSEQQEGIVSEVTYVDGHNLRVPACTYMRICFFWFSSCRMCSMHSEQDCGEIHTDRQPRQPDSWTHRKTGRTDGRTDKKDSHVCLNRFKHLRTYIHASMHARRHMQKRT